MLLEQAGQSLRGDFALIDVLSSTLRFSHCSYFSLFSCMALAISRTYKLPNYFVSNQNRRSRPTISASWCSPITVIPQSFIERWTSITTHTLPFLSFLLTSPSLTHTKRTYTSRAVLHNEYTSSCFLRSVVSFVTLSSMAYELDYLPFSFIEYEFLFFFLIPSIAPNTDSYYTLSLLQGIRFEHKTHTDIEITNKTWLSRCLVS